MTDAQGTEVAEAARAQDAADAPIEKLPPKVWVGLILFAAFVVGTSTCVINFFVN